MAVMVPREKWTDERLDDLNEKVDRGFAETKTEMREGFARVDADIRELRSEMNARFAQVDTRFAQVDARFNTVDARFEQINEGLDSLNRTIIGGAIAIIATLVGLSAF